jgi:hypothetical protein
MKEVPITKNLLKYRLRSTVELIPPKELISPKEGIPHKELITHKVSIPPKELILSQGRFRFGLIVPYTVVCLI